MISSAPDATPAAFFSAAWAQFDAAQGENWRDSLCVGGTHCLFEGKGQGMRQALLPALAHLKSDASQVPQLHLRTWDGAETHGGLPSLPVGPGDAFEHGRIARLCSDDHLVIWEPHFSSVTLLDRIGRRAIYFTTSAHALPYYETAAPLRALWHAWFSIQGALPVHGACVGRNGRALLLTAPAGSGKSTTALLALAAGFDYLADDWSLLQPRGGPFVHSLFNTAKLRPDNLHRFSALRSHIHNYDRLDEEKATIFLQQHFPNQLRPSSQLKAIVIPRVSGKPDTCFERTSSAAAWHALFKVTLQGIAGSGRELVTLLGELVRCAPVYTLHLGHELDQVPHALEAILQDE